MSDLTEREFAVAAKVAAAGLVGTVVWCGPQAERCRARGVIRPAKMLMENAALFRDEKNDCCRGTVRIGRKLVTGVPAEMINARTIDKTVLTDPIAPVQDQHARAFRAR